MSRNNPYIIGITGGSASGKTRFIHDLGQLFTKEEICILSQDNYYKTAEFHKRDEQGHINYDLPECIDFDELFKDLNTLKQGKVVKRREYRFQHENQHGEWFEVNPAPIILIEGLFIFHERSIFDMFDLKIYMETAEEIQLQRRINRDTLERNIPIDFVHYQWQNHVLPAYRSFLLPYKEEADIIIMNNRHFSNSLKLLKDHFKQVLNHQ